MQYKVHYLCMVLYVIDDFADEWMDNIGECFIKRILIMRKKLIEINLSLDIKD